MLRDDAVGQGETNAVSGGLGCEERYEDPLQIRRRDPVASVFDFNRCPFFTGLIALG